MHMKVGRLTLAVALILLGAVLVVDNLLQTQLAWFLARLWPGLLILLGLDWVYAAARIQEGGDRIRTDGGAIALLVILAIIAGNVGPMRRGSVQWHSSPLVEFSVPSPPSPPPLPGFGTSSVPAEHLLARQFEPGVREFSLSAGAGSVEIYEGPDLLVELRVIAYGRDRAEAEALVRRVQLKVDAGTGAKVSAVVPQELNRAELRFKVMLPPDVAVAVDTSSGAVAVRQRTGATVVQTSSGAIEVGPVTGHVDLRTSSGSVRASEVSGSATVTTSSGKIELVRIGGDVRATSTSGAISITEAGAKVSAQATSGAVRLTTSQVAGSYDLGSVSSSVRLEIPASAGVTVDARSSSGTVSGPRWLTIGEGRNSGTGTQGDGAHRVSIRTSSGSISVEAR